MDGCAFVLFHSQKYVYSYTTSICNDHIATFDLSDPSLCLSVSLLHPEYESTDVESFLLML